jgi:DNA-directed RNA polymerase specialized sigma24 family protein
MFDPKIQDTIEYHTRHIARTCKLDTQSTDDVRQELTLTALEAIKNHSGTMTANLLTYVKAALNRGVAGVIRKIKNTPPSVNADSVLRANEVQDEYRRQLEPGKPYEPLTISLGTPLEQLIECQSEHDSDFKLDMETILSPRQKVVCRMLMTGQTQADIARKLQSSQPTICREIQRIRSVFEEKLSRCE